VAVVEERGDAAAVERLVPRAAGGDAAAFAALYDHFAPRVRRFLRYRVGDAELAEDLLQQTFLKMIEALPRYHQTGVPFGAWVFRVARNLVIDELRTAHPAAPLELADDRPCLADDPVVEAIRADDRERLLAAMKMLPTDQRDVLAWRFLAELSPAETAVLMGRNTEAVRSLQYRAICAMRTLLGDAVLALGVTP
jgi:RNA polymerase sigma-70 factor, ECF subfamily